MSQCAVQVASDFSGLKRAALEMLEEVREGPRRERIERLAQSAANPEEIIEGSGVHRSLAEGFYGRVAYLFDLESFMGLGVEPRFDLDMTEVRGLLAIASARAEFDRLHPQCRGCGVRLENEWDKTCGECSREKMGRGS